MKRTAVCVGLALAGCSAIVKDVEVSCSDDTDCAALNAREGLGENDCEHYQCREPSKGCQKLPRDDDDDTYLDRATCAHLRPVAELDCDDRKDLGKGRHPHAMEICDGIDNNCSGEIDEGVWVQVAPEPIEVSPVDWLSTGEPGLWGLPLVTTTKKFPSAISELFLLSTEGPVADRPPRLSLQNESTECTKDPELMPEGCTLHQPAIALASDAWIAMAVDVAGCAVGTVRFASGDVDEGASLPLWDGDSSEASNLRLGVPGVAACASPGARAPALAVGPESRGTTRHGLALWRASPANAAEPAPGLLLGLGLEVRADPNDSPSVRALSNEPPVPLRENAKGIDPAAVLPWQDGFLVAHDTPEGLELAYVKQLERGLARAFAAASRLPFARSGARHVALAVGRTSSADERDAIAVSWLSRGARGETLHFATFSPTSPDRLASQGALSPLILVSDAVISAGPALAHVSRSFTVDGDGNEVGGWFVLWIEGSTGRQALKVARVRADGSRPLETRELHNAVSLKHVFAHALEGNVRYGFVSSDEEVSGEGEEQQLNVGSLLCGR